MSHRPRGDLGVAAVLVLSLAAVLVLVAVLSTSLAAVAVARSRATGVADLSALAAAGQALTDPAAACARADRLARSNGGRLTVCVVDGEQVEVVAEVRPPGRLGRLGAATARARAGPVAGLGRSALLTTPPRVTSAQRPSLGP